MPLAVLVASPLGGRSRGSVPRTREVMNRRCVSFANFKRRRTRPNFPHASGYDHDPLLARLVG